LKPARAAKIEEDADWVNLKNVQLIAVGYCDQSSQLTAPRWLLANSKGFVK
jgi:hypothetical protein